jgi:hypothetical protein
VKDIEALIERAKEPMALDEATMAFLSKAETLDAVERLESAVQAFKTAIGAQLVTKLRTALRDAAARTDGHWEFIETSRVETYLGLRPAGQILRYAEDFWPVFAFSSSPGLPFTAPWLGIFTTPRADARIKRELHALTHKTVSNPKRDDPADWWVQWDWVPDWPDASRPRNLALMVGPAQDKLVASVTQWCVAQAQTIGDVLRRETGEGW